MDECPCCHRDLPARPGLGSRYRCECGEVYVWWWTRRRWYPREEYLRLARRPGPSEVKC